MSPLLIQGDFRPGPGLRLFRLSAVLLSLLLVGMIGVVACVYGLNVHYHSAITDVGQQTRRQDEQNKSLQVRLNRLKAYHNVASALHAVPYLNDPEQIVDIGASASSQLLRHRPAMYRARPLPVYGY